ncbi:hydrogenase formation protein HypD [Tepidibacillus decaturensis]|uniref:Hydrogenase formation protein HypD n=1 Tax=Tepidibacillus decaturensis TaxID=1413211 RepID=A0A135L686_9BACI|nr:hydrogenase formation protein HypD [Tepidibacillus decaturensis]KXG44439.1 hydrogenase formation protein HypD [Tepidibacillus decaturensis]
MLEILNESSNPELSRKLLAKVMNLANLYKDKYGRLPAIMEVCGSHTMALARTGIKKSLKDHVKLISGPGCPVCVTDQKSIDAMIQLAEGENRIICTFGDMIRVPGTKRSLMEAKTEGREIRVVYSPVDAVEIAKKHSDKEVVFLGIGFETTIPVLTVALKMADDEGITNFSMWLTTKLVEPIIRHLLESEVVKIDGFLLPGHVSIVLGKNSYQYLVDEYQMPGVISGFESVEMLSSIYKLLQLLLQEKAEIINDHRSIVTDKGNQVAQKLMETYLTLSDEAWRGIGIIKNSGLDLREEYAHLNAKKRFNMTVGEPRKTACRCGEIIRGIITPEECSLFNKACTPLHPIGPCMVSSEGTCAAHYQYMREE